MWDNRWRLGGLAANRIEDRVYKLFKKVINLVETSNARILMDEDDSHSYLQCWILSVTADGLSVDKER